MVGVDKCRGSPPAAHALSFCFFFFSFSFRLPFPRGQQPHTTAVTAPSRCVQYAELVGGVCGESRHGTAPMPATAATRLHTEKRRRLPCAAGAYVRTVRRYPTEAGCPSQLRSAVTAREVGGGGGERGAPARSSFNGHGGVTAANDHPGGAAPRARIRIRVHAAAAQRGRACGARRRRSAGRARPRRQTRGLTVQIGRSPPPRPLSAPASRAAAT